MPELRSRYEELQRVDAALRIAEDKLRRAHLVRGCGVRPESLYREVVQLRARARELLDTLADILIDGTLPGTAAQERSHPRE